MELLTTGANANSWVTLSQANIILLEVPASFYGYEGTDEFQFESEDIKWLVEAHRQISSNWTFRGRKVDPRQRLAFPRTGFMIESAGCAGDWFETNFPHLPASHAAYTIALHWDTPGLSAYEELDNDEIPTDLKEAAVILAALLKNGGSLYEDNKGDSTAYSLGGISGDNINAKATAEAVFQRVGQWGAYIGKNLNKAGGSRV